MALNCLKRSRNGVINALNDEKRPPFFTVFQPFSVSSDYGPFFLGTLATSFKAVSDEKGREIKGL
jgi:hypothetical protein